MEGCGLNFVKYYLIAFNALFTISGIVMLVVGGIILHGLKIIRDYIDVLLFLLPILFLIIGLLVFIVSFFGCCGAIRESIKCLVAYAVLLSIICLLEVVTGVGVVVKKTNFVRDTRNYLNEGMELYTHGKQANWDLIQGAFACCGVDSPADWGKYVGEGNVPASCCRRNNPLNYRDNTYVCKFVPNDESLNYVHGCWELLKGNIKGYTDTILGVGLGFAFLELIGIVLALLMAYELKKEEELK